MGSKFTVAAVVETAKNVFSEVSKIAENITATGKKHIIFEEKTHEWAQGYLPVTGAAFIGEGPGSKVQYTGSTPEQMISLENVENITISHMTFDMQATGDVAEGGHIVRLDNSENVRFLFNNFKNARAYAIGPQQGPTVNLLALGNDFDSSQIDQMDFKNQGNANKGNRVAFNTFKKAGLEESDTSANLDGRGPFVAIGNFFTEYGLSRAGANRACVGLRFRGGDTGDIHGVGGRYSTSVANYFEPNSNNFTTAISVENPDTVSLGDHAIGHKTGVYVFDGHARNVFVGFQGVNVADHTFFLEGDKTQLIGCTSTGCTNADISIDAKADLTTIIGGVYDAIENNQTDPDTLTLLGVPNFKNLLRVNGGFRVHDAVSGNLFDIDTASTSTHFNKAQAAHNFKIGSTASDQSFKVTPAGLVSVNGGATGAQFTVNNDDTGTVGSIVSLAAGQSASDWEASVVAATDNVANWNHRSYSFTSIAVGAGPSIAAKRTGGATADLGVFVTSGDDRVQAAQFSSDKSLYLMGGLTCAPKASVTPQNNGDMTVEATSDTVLTFKLKGSDGTVRAGTIALA